MPNNTIGEAYLQIKPSMDGISREIQGAMGDAGSKGSSSFGSAFASGLKKMGTIALSATAAATTAVGAFGAQAVKSFASFEQLEGGVKKLYGDAADEIMKYANQAYKTSGMSANDYMETATSFSASLINSLGGDMSKAAEMTDIAMRAMSDNVNTFGSDFESVQNAFKGFSKGNFTMLDNLKLGYGGTKEEMERLMRDAEKYGKLVEGSLKMDSFADIITAVQLIQEELNVAGTTGKEAMTTIEGSATATKAAWENLVTSIGRGERISESFDALFNSLFGEKSGEGLVNQIIPRIKTVVEGIGTFISKAGPVIADTIPKLVSSMLPTLMPSVSTVLETLAQLIVELVPGIMESVLPKIVPSAVTLLMALGKAIIDSLPILVEVALQIILELANALTAALPTLIPAVVEIILGIADYLVDNVDLLIDAAIQLVIGLAQGIINALPALIEKLPIIIVKIVGGILAGIPKVITAGLEIIGALWEGIKEGIFGAFEWGADLISNFVQGIFSGVGKLWDGIKGIAGGIADFLGFSEPEKGPLSDFHTYAPDMMQLFAKGIKDNESIVYDQIADTFDFGGKLGDFGIVANGNQNLNLGGTIRVEGVNNQGEFIAASEYAVEEIITNIMKREARLA